MDGLTGLLPPTMLPNESVLQQTLPLQSAASQADAWQMQVGIWLQMLRDHQACRHHHCTPMAATVSRLYVCACRRYADSVMPDPAEYCRVAAAIVTMDLTLTAKACTWHGGCGPWLCWGRGLALQRRCWQRDPGLGGRQAC